MSDVPLVLRGVQRTYRGEAASCRCCAAST
jgi:hypothetical protein